MRKTVPILLFLLVVVTWGTTWMAMGLAVKTIPPIFATGLRFAIASPILLAIAYIRRSPILFPRGQRKFQLIVSLAYFAIPFFLMIYGEQYISPGLSALIFSSMPVAVLVFSIVSLNEKVTTRQMVGLAISLTALALILVESAGIGGNNSLRGIVALVGAVLMHAVVYTQCKKHCCTVSVITFNSLPCLVASILLLITGWLVESPQLAQFSITSIYSVIYLGGFAGICGILSYFYLQQRIGAFRASLAFVAFPMVAILLQELVGNQKIPHLVMALIAPLATGIIFVLMPATQSAGATKKSEAELMSYDAHTR